MAQEMIQVPVRILDKEYTVACPVAEREGLLESARMLNERMREIRMTGKVIGSERIAVIAALNLAHELLQARQHGSEDHGAQKQRLRRLQERIENVLQAQGPQLGL